MSSSLAVVFVAGANVFVDNGPRRQNRNCSDSVTDQIIGVTARVSHALTTHIFLSSVWIAIEALALTAVNASPPMTARMPNAPNPSAVVTVGTISAAKAIVLLVKLNITL